MTATPTKTNGERAGHRALSTVRAKPVQERQNTFNRNTCRLPTVAAHVRLLTSAAGGRSVWLVALEGRAAAMRGEQARPSATP